MVPGVLLGILCYLIGSIPFPIIVSRLVRGIDLREHGSGNMGATNAARVLGKEWFPVVFGLDFAKGAASAFLCSQFLPGWLGISPTLAAAIGGALACAGHCFPVFAGFRGGLGLAASAGALVLITPWLLVAVLAAIGLFWLLLGNMYVGVALGALTGPVLAYLLVQSASVAAVVAAWAALVFALHLKDIRAYLVARKKG
jgi:glycerol-3-phosphate acyltransferase PlsY